MGSLLPGWDNPFTPPRPGSLVPQGAEPPPPRAGASWPSTDPSASVAAARLSEERLREARARLTAAARAPRAPASSPVANASSDLLLRDMQLSAWHRILNDAARRRRSDPFAGVSSVDASAVASIAAAARLAEVDDPERTFHRLDALSLAGHPPPTRTRVRVRLSVEPATREEMDADAAVDAASKAEETTAKASAAPIRTASPSIPSNRSDESDESFVTVDLASETGEARDVSPRRPASCFSSCFSASASSRESRRRLDRPTRDADAGADVRAGSESTKDRTAVSLARAAPPVAAVSRGARVRGGVDAASAADESDETRLRVRVRLDVVRRPIRPNERGDDDETSVRFDDDRDSDDDVDRASLVRVIDEARRRRDAVRAMAARERSESAESTSGWWRRAESAHLNRPASETEKAAADAEAAAAEEASARVPEPVGSFSLLSSSSSPPGDGVRAIPPGLRRTLAEMEALGERVDAESTWPGRQPRSGSRRRGRGSRFTPQFMRDTRLAFEETRKGGSGRTGTGA